MERVYIMIKPDGLKRRLVGEIISRLERKGLYLLQMKVVLPTEDLLRSHYAAHVEKSFFKPLMEYMMSGPVVAMAWEGVNAVKVSRTVVGSTNPVDALPGTIRGDFGMSVGRNLIHCSDSVEAGVSEIKIWFGGEKVESNSFDRPLIYE